MISISGLKKTYVDNDGSQVRVLDGVELSVPAADFLAVVGSSGSGKSTLLHILGGLDVHYEGEVDVVGVKPRGLNDAALARYRNQTVGFVFQSFHLIPNLSAKDNVLLPHFFSDQAATDAGKRADEVLARVGLEGKSARPPSRLSGGERQRVAIARALFGKPRVLLCDEPTGNLDATTGAEIIQLFSDLNRDGITLVTVTHEARLANAAKRVLKLEGGRLSPQPKEGT